MPVPKNNQRFVGIDIEPEYVGSSESSSCGVSAETGNALVDLLPFNPPGLGIPDLPFQFGIQGMGHCR